MVLTGYAGTTETTTVALDIVLSVLADMDSAYYGVTHIGGCGARDVWCDCLRCKHSDGLTEFDYTLNGIVQTARVYGL